MLKQQYSRCKQDAMTVWRSVLALGLLSLLAACGGSSGNSGSELLNSPTSSGADPYPPINLNGSLTGRVFETGKASYVDLDTGETVQLAGDSAYPSRDGLEVVELHEDARFLPDGGCYDFSVFNDLIIIRDALSGRVTDSFELPESVYGPVKLSPDGQTLALYWSKSHTCYDEDNSVTVLSRSGEEIIRGSKDISSFDWLPDDRLVFTLEQKLAIEVERNTFRYRTIADMSNITGTPGRVAVSPDGTQVLFEMITDNSLWLSTVSYRDATAWAVNIDGSNLRRIATTSRPDDPDKTNDNPQVNMPVWSPDGSTLLLTENYTSGGLILTDDAFVVIDVLPVSNQGLSYALPVNNAEQQLPPASYSADGIRPILGTDLDGERRALALNPFSSVMWAPALSRVPFAQGGLPSYNSRVNRGLEGKLYLMDDNAGDYDEPVMKVIDLASGTVNIHTIFNDDQLDFTSTSTAVSADAALIAHHVYESLDEQYLRVYDSAGQQMHSLSFFGDSYSYVPESALRFSPVNSNYLAWIHDDENFGTGAVVIDLSTRRFVAHWSSRDYDTLAWSHEGDLLLFDEGQAYRSRVEDGTFGNLELLFEFGDSIKHPDVNPINGDIAFQSGGQILAISLDGQNLRRMTAYTEIAVDYPSWSPDGKYLSVKQERTGFIIAADTLDARLYEKHRSLAAFEIGESGSESMPGGYGRLEWR